MRRRVPDFRMANATRRPSDETSGAGRQDKLHPDICTPGRTITRSTLDLAPSNEDPPAVFEVVRIARTIVGATTQQCEIELAFLAF